MNQVQSVTISPPEWAQGRYLDEAGCCRSFLTRYPMQYVEGRFYGLDGPISEDRLRKLLYDYLQGIVFSGISTKISALVEVLKMECQAESLPEPQNRICCANGSFLVFENRFVPKKEICRHRLPIAYNPDAPRPRRWETFLEELLEPEDILTLQEFMGYCLLPINFAQKMLLIIGEGGEGKSRVGIVLSHLLGSNMVNGSLSKLETSPFARADLQGRLLLVDDDLRLEGLRSTNYLKTIITAEQPLDLEKKGLQSYQGKVNCRLMAFGNGSLRALHDRSYGFFRRQIILTAKPRDPHRVDDPYLAGTLFKELPGILLWCMEGLYRLLGQQMQFTLSQRSRENLHLAMTEGNNTPDFLASQGYIRPDSCGSIPSRKLYELYCQWCHDNALSPLPSRTFISAVTRQAPALGIRYDTNIDDGNGRRVRGFTGIRAQSPFTRV